MEDKESSLDYACALGLLGAMLEEYIFYCHKAGADAEVSGGDKKASKKNKNRFPNVSGFCRYFGIGNNEYESLEAKYPSEFDRLRAVFEDEAFNSDVSPTLLSAYLKKRLGYEKKEGSEIFDGQLKVIFDHDIMEDGE